MLVCRSQDFAVIQFRKTLCFYRSSLFYRGKTGYILLSVPSCFVCYVYPLTVHRRARSSSQSFIVLISSASRGSFMSLRYVFFAFRRLFFPSFALSICVSPSGARYLMCPSDRKASSLRYLLSPLQE